MLRILFLLTLLGASPASAGAVLFGVEAAIDKASRSARWVGNNPGSQRAGVEN